MNNNMYSIDFGTCNSVISYLNENDDVKHIYDPVSGNILIPTTLYFIKDDINDTFEHRKNYFIGSEANENYHIYKDSKCYFHQFKRFLGLTSKSNLFEFDFIKKLNLKYELDEDNVYLFIPCKDKEMKISVVELIRLYIDGLRDYINVSNLKVYITAPAYFNDLQKNQLQSAYQLSGCKVVKYFNEPTAATIYYLNTFYKEERGIKKIAIFDVGGGTTDITVVEYEFETKTCDVIDVSGNNSLGGVDIDNLLIDDIYKNNHIHRDNVKWKTKISNIAENIKIQLSSLYTVKIIVEEVPVYINDVLTIKETMEITYTRTQFNNLIMGIVVELTKLLTDMQNTHDIFDVIPIGGTTQIPIIYDKINVKNNTEISNDKKYLYKSIVADGACVMSKLIKNNDDFIIMDIVPMNLYIKTDSYLCVIPKNSKIPTTKEYVLTTSRDAQRSIEIEIYEGENKYHIGSYSILNIPPFKKGSIIITLSFKINCSGLMNVSLKGCMNKANEKGTFELEKEIKIISNTCIKKLIKACLKKSNDV